MGGALACALAAGPPRDRRAGRHQPGGSPERPAIAIEGMVAGGDGGHGRHRQRHRRSRRPRWRTTRRRCGRCSSMVGRPASSRRAWATIACPALIITSRQDHVVDPANSDILAGRGDRTGRTDLARAELPRRHPRLRQGRGRSGHGRVRRHGSATGSGEPRSLELRADLPEQRQHVVGGVGACGRRARRGAGAAGHSTGTSRSARRAPTTPASGGRCRRRCPRTARCRRASGTPVERRPAPRRRPTACSVHMPPPGASSSASTSVAPAATGPPDDLAERARGRRCARTELVVEHVERRSPPPWSPWATRHALVAGAEVELDAVNVTDRNQISCTDRHRSSVGVPAHDA